MFEQPSTIIEHFSRPIFIAMTSVILVLAFGIFLIYLATLVSFRRVKLLNLEMEINPQSDRSIKVANQFLYTSTMLHNHTENIKYLLTNQFSELEQILQFLAESYRNSAQEYNNELELTIKVKNSPELIDRIEKRLYRSIVRQTDVKSTTVYRNRLINGNNVLLGVVPVSEEKDVIMIVFRGYGTPFDTYDQETFETILASAMILYEMLLLIQIASENHNRK